MDRAATAGGLRARRRAPVSHPGPRPGLWRAILSSSLDVGHPGSGHCASLAWQNAYAERVIGSIRRECLDRIPSRCRVPITTIWSKYVDYYNDTPTDLSLAKDAPEPRSVQGPSRGRVVAIPRVGGLHHEYLRRTA